MCKLDEMTTCVVNDCDRPVTRRGWCGSHYQRWWVHGDVQADVPLRARRHRPQHVDTEEAVFAWYMPGEPPSEGCWDWTGTLAKGYGQFEIGDTRFRAHRTAYRIFNGPLADDQDVLHSCDRPICVQPTHLGLGDQAANSTEMVERGRSMRGERQHLAKLTEADVIWIREQTEMTQTAMARALGVHQATVSEVVLRKTWKHV